MFVVNLSVFLTRGKPLGTVGPANLSKSRASKMEVNFVVALAYF